MPVWRGFSLQWPLKDQNEETDAAETNFKYTLTVTFHVKIYLTATELNNSPESVKSSKNY